MRFLLIKNWGAFQHYKERRPPWIKLYTHLLDDLDYLRLSDAAQAGLPRVWLLAARLGHPLPYDLDLIAGKAVIKKKALLELIECGWLVASDATENASADASTDASETLGSHARGRALATEDRGKRTELHIGIRPKFADPAHADAYDAYRRSHRMPDGFDATLRAVHEPPTGGAGYPWAVIGAALVEMRGASADFSPAALRGFCRRLVQGEAPARANGHGGRQARNLEAIGEFLEGSSG